MKNFSELEVGDTVFLIDIIGSELPKENIIKELTVREIQKAKDSSHFTITLSNNFVITTIGVFPFHTSSSEASNNLLSNMYEEIYATDKKECIRIARNSVKIRIRKIHSIIDSCRSQLDKLGDSAFSLSLLKDNLPIEVVAEAVIV